MNEGVYLIQDLRVSYPRHPALARRVVGLWLSKDTFLSSWNPSGMDVNVYTIDVVVMRLILQLAQSDLCVTNGSAVLW